MNDPDTRPAVDGAAPEARGAGTGLTARLEQLREDAGRPTLETIARNAGRSIGAVSNTFTGKAVPSDATARRILAALGSSFDDEWRLLLEEARRDRDRRSAAGTGPATDSTDGVASPPESAPTSRRGRIALIAGIGALAVAAAAAVALLPRWSDADRSGSGAVRPVVVTDAGPLGLVVRSSGARDGEQIGSAAEGQTLWAECRTRTDFDPRPDTGTGPVWYRVRWPNSGPTKEFFGSTPQDGFSGWVFGGYVVPRRPDDTAIPPC